MKLIVCVYCDDVLKITNTQRNCSCGRCYAYLENKTDGSGDVAYISKDAIPFALDNIHFSFAVYRWVKDKRTSFVHGWMIDSTDEKNDIRILEDAL